jgi:uncharacterized protein YcnI
MQNRMTPCLLLLAGPLLVSQTFAHVAIFPREAPSGSRHHFFEVRAPVEEGVPTVELKIEIPAEWKEAGGQVDRVEYNPNWQVDIQRDEDNWIQAITWHGAEAPSYAYIHFGMIITLPDLTGMQQVKAWQKYADGKVVAFIEDRNQEGALNPKPGILLLEDAGAPSTEPMASDGQAEGNTSPLLYLGLSALIGGVIGGVLVKLTTKNG